MEYYGHLALRIGFIKETGNTATVYATGKYTSNCRLKVSFDDDTFMSHVVHN